ncbi:MAG TPA: MBL fold metallo-hydrolase, partial [bacterium]
VHKAEAAHFGIPASELVQTDAHSRLTVGGIAIEFIHTPGHTPGSQCFKLGDRLISGDTLFIGSCGRVDLPGSSPGALYESLTQKLMKLPDATLVFPGHNYAEHATHTDIATEKARNPFFRFPDKQTFLAAMGY